MKFSCEKALLLSGIQTAARTTAAKSTIPALEGLLLEAEDALTITGYNLKTGIRTRVEAEIAERGSIVLNARLFGDIVRKMSDDVIHISVDESLMVHLSCGQSRFEIMATTAEDYPELPSIDGSSSIRVAEGTLKSMISQTIFAVSDSEARPVHTGSLFEIEGDTLTIVSVDGFRLALRRETLAESNMVDGSFVVPGAALSEVEKIAQDRDETLKITLGAKHILFNIGDTELISRRLEGEFLDYKRSVPKESKYSIVVDRRTAIDSIERVSLIISEKTKSPIRCRFDENMLSIRTVTPLGRASDECPVSGDAEGLEIGFNNKYMLDALKAAPAAELCVQLTSSIAPCILEPADESGKFLYMVLPVRIRSED